MQPIVIAVAPTGAWGVGDDNPTTPEAVTRDVVDCARVGASVVHLHARDAAGHLTTDLSPLNETIRAIRNRTDIIVEVSTGGLSPMNARERTLPVGRCDAELASLNVGSLNFGDHVYRNSVPNVRYWIDVMRRAEVHPSIEVFDTGHVETALHLIDEGLLRVPYNFSFIFGVQWGMPFDDRLARYLRTRIPAGSLAGAILVGSASFDAHVAVCDLGFRVVRVGFEDSHRYNGAIAATNAELVEAVRARLTHAGYRIATVGEARELLLWRHWIEETV